MCDFMEERKAAEEQLSNPRERAEWPTVEKAINSIPFALAYRIDFKDGGESEIQVIQRGLSGETAAEELAKLVPAVAYNGNRSVKGAFLVWGPEENFGEKRF